MHTNSQFLNLFLCSRDLKTDIFNCTFSIIVDSISDKVDNWTSTGFPKKSRIIGILWIFQLCFDLKRSHIEQILKILMVRVFLDTLYPFVLYYYTKNCGMKKKGRTKVPPCKEINHYGNLYWLLSCSTKFKLIKDF